jgi:hypothetical protein
MLFINGKIKEVHGTRYMVQGSGCKEIRIKVKREK